MKRACIFFETADRYQFRFASRLNGLGIKTSLIIWNFHHLFEYDRYQSLGILDFEVCLKPTADFKAFLASKGRWLVVLSPQSIAEEVMDIHQESIKAYSKLKI